MVRFLKGRIKLANSQVIFVNYYIKRITRLPLYVNVWFPFDCMQFCWYYFFFSVVFIRSRHGDAGVEEGYFGIGMPA